jgi:hypothetical protein
MFSISSSLIFLLSVRTTLSEFVDISEELGETDKTNLKNFFINEGTDYEIMHFFVRGSFPEKRYDLVVEAEIYEELKSDIRKDFTLLKKFIDEETIKSVITEVAPISSKGLSSSAIMLEFIASGAINLSEDSIKIPVGSGTPEWKTKAGKMWARIRKLPASVYSVLQKSAQQGKIHNITAYYAKHKKAAHLIAAGVAVTLATIAAYKIYKNKLSPAGKACKQYTGPEKAYCMKKFKIEALKGQVDALKTASSACSNTADPEKCRNVLDRKIKRAEERISRLSKQV